MRKKLLIVGIIIGILAIGFAIKSVVGNKIEVEAYKVKIGEIANYVEDIGTIKSRNERTIYANSMGEVQRINYKSGDVVKEGDVLVELDYQEIDLKIKGLEAQMEGLKASYKEAIKPVDSSRLKQAQANVDSIKIRLEEAKRQAENNKKLYEEGGISQDTYETSLNNVKQQENVLSIAQSELELLQKGVSGNIKNQYEAQITELAYQISILEKEREKYIIKSPLDGIVMDVPVEEGMVVQPGTKIIEIGNNDDFYVEADILASEIGKIKNKADVIIESEDIGVEVKGKVERIYPKAISTISDLGIEQKRVRLEISLEDITNLRPGYEVDVNIFESGAQDTIIIPENSVFEMDDGIYVFVIEKDALKLRKIEVGIEGEELIEVKSGLKEGERVVISPVKDLEEGMKVTIINEIKDK